MQECIDLHCDLLAYLAGGEGRDPEDGQARSGPGIWEKAGVRCQVLAIFVSSAQERVFAERQVLAYQKITSATTLLPAVENASAFCGEEESLERGLLHLSRWTEEIGKPLYVSLTWNGKNRFGGGAEEPAPLTEEGKELLRALAEREIAVDLSHASDILAEGILTCIAEEQLSLSLLASHSNYRARCKVWRNLPDELAKELIRRQGLIGLCLIKPFLSTEPKEPLEAILGMIEHALSLGGEESLALGGDWFFLGDLPSERQQLSGGYFYPGYDNELCYTRLLPEVRERFGERVMKKLACENAQRWLQRCNRELHSPVC